MGEPPPQAQSFRYDDIHLGSTARLDAQWRFDALTERFGLTEKWARFVARMEDQA